MADSNIDKHQRVLDEIHATYIAKDHDYGSSFADLYREFGLTSSVIRISDKMARLKALANAPAKVKDESIRDTLLDLANYAIMTVAEMDKEGDGQSDTL